MDKIKQAEVRGFFFADGCVSLHKRRTRNVYVRKDGTRAKDEWRINHVVRVQINQRKDNLPFLKELQEMFGGQIYIQRNENVKFSHGIKSTYNHKQTAYWSVQSIPACQKVLSILVDTPFTYSKIDAVKSALEYCNWKLERGLQTKLSEKDRQKIEGFITRVRQATKYKE
jgi:hypothetical protein